MTFNQTHKDFIENTIGYLFDLPVEDEALLRIEIQKIMAAFQAKTEGDYEPLSRVFHDPTTISRIDDCGELTFGEARKYMIEYVDLRIVKAVEKLEGITVPVEDSIEEHIKAIKDLQKRSGKTSKNLIKSHTSAIEGLTDGYRKIFERLATLGWDKASLLKTLEARKDNEEKLISKPISPLDWQSLEDPQDQMRGHGLSYDQIYGMQLGMSYQEVQDPRFSAARLQMAHMERARDGRLNAANAPLSLLQNEAIRLGLTYTQVQHEYFGEYLLELLRPFRNCMRIEATHQLVQHCYDLYAEGVALGLTHEQIERGGIGTHCFGSHTLNAMCTLRARNADLSVTEAFEQVRGLQALQVEGVIEEHLKPKQVRYATFGQHTLDGIRFFKALDSNLSSKDAHKKVSGLTKDEVEVLIRPLAYSSGITPVAYQETSTSQIRRFRRGAPIFEHRTRLNEDTTSTGHSRI